MAWSDEARRAALEARRMHAKPKPAILAQHVQDGYTLTIYSKIPPLLRGMGRKGMMTITDPKGTKVRAGFWMDFPEKHWNLTAKQYRAMAVTQRAAMEAREQATKWGPLSKQFSFYRERR